MPEDRYYDGLTAAAHRVTVSSMGDMLVIATSERPDLARWPVADMRVIDSNKVTGAINFGRLSDPAPRLMLHDSPARQQLLDENPHLKQWRAQAIKRGWTVGLAWTLAGLVIATGCYFAWRDGSAYLARYVPKAWEKKLGAHIYTALNKNLTICKAPAGNAALRKLVDRLAPPQLQRDAGKQQDGITIDVVDIKLPNAFALPGDHVMVTSGLIDLATSPDMVSGVVAHEIGHLDLRHPTQSAISNLGISATVSIILGGSSVGDIATLLTVMSYSRKMEHEADIRGLELLKNAGLRADGMAEFFKVMKDKFEKDGDSLIPDWLASHPGLSERADYTKADAAGATAMTDTDWQALKDVCKVK
ncbi:M48 family metallopeptidase [Dongia rigui]|uniref:M48 family metallopeptidase n=1 Tax=Dongia rigui TaxID=940149 RepID=A0ABU5E0E7_9PROT|nr:M48 family metallopeptidase [Dongia rigui]MDY0872953.1 M48 family metallopeptidase [Dongia rigui]